MRRLRRRRRAETLPPAWAGTSPSARRPGRCRSRRRARISRAPKRRLAHVTELLPEICTLDCGTMNFGEGDYIMTNHPVDARGHGRAGCGGARSASGDRDLRYRPSRAREVAGGAGLHRRAGDGAALHGDPVGRARRHRHPDVDGEQPAGGVDVLGVSRSAATSFPTWRWRCSRAATSVSGSRTTSGSTRAFLATNADLVRRAVAISAETWACACSAPRRCGRSSRFKSAERNGGEVMRHRLRLLRPGVGESAGRICGTNMKVAQAPSAPHRGRWKR